MTDRKQLSGAVSPGLLRRYLRSNGWLPTTHSDISLYTLPPSNDGDELEIVLPATDQKTEAASSFIQSAIETLAQLNAQSIQEVIAEVRQIGADVIRNVVPDPYVRGDSVTLNLAEEFLSGFRAFLSSAGTMELAPTPFHLKTLKDGQAFADSCRFGHTFRGSFGFTIEAPIELHEEQLIAGHETVTPFSRRVVERVARGLRLVDKAAKAEDPSLIAKSFERAMDANMCEGLATLLERTSVASLGISVSFSPEWPVAKDLAASSKVRLVADHAELLHSASKLLRKPEEVRPETIIGRVRGLRTDGNPADLFKDPAARNVEILWQSQENRLVTVHVLLEPADYLRAVQAHAEGKFVQVTGMLANTHRKWILDDAHDFSVMG